MMTVAPLALMRFMTHPDRRQPEIVRSHLLEHVVGDEILARAVGLDDSRDHKAGGIVIDMKDLKYYSDNVLRL